MRRRHRADRNQCAVRPSPRQLAARFEIMLHLSGFSDTVRARRGAKVLAEVPTARASPTDLFWLGAMATEEGNRGEAEHWGNALASRAMGLRSEGETSAADYAEAYAAALSAFGDLLRADSTSLSDFETALGKLPAADYTREQPQSYLRYRVGQVLFDRGELDAATRYFGSFHPYDFYTSPAEYYLGRIGEAKAERDEAAAHYRRFLTWWRDADPELRPLIERLMRREAAASFTPAAEQDLEGYADALLVRFANPALKHRLAQIAMDGSQKIPQRWLASLAAHQARGELCEATLTALAAWLHHVRGGPLVNDPLAGELAAAWRENGAGGIVPALFGPDGLIGSPWRPGDSERKFIEQRLRL